MHDTPPLRVAVVGASAGLGRCIAMGLSQRNARVAFLARRRDRLVKAADEAGNGALAVACDVTDSATCRHAVDEVVAAFGGLDALVYTTGVGVLAPLTDVSGDQWANLFATNVTGASLITAAAASHLAAAAGSAIYLSSLSASYSAPWPLLGAYAVSKAALDKLVEAWRIEHPNIGFTRLADGVQQNLGPRCAREGHPILDGQRLHAGRPRRRRSPRRRGALRTRLRQQQFHPVSDPGATAIRCRRRTSTMVKDISR